MIGKDVIVKADKILMSLTLTEYEKLEALEALGVDLEDIFHAALIIGDAQDALGGV